MRCVPTVPLWLGLQPSLLQPLLSTSCLYRIFVLQTRTNKPLDMKIGEFEEVILLLVGILEDEAYALRIAEAYEAQVKRSASIGAVHSALSRLSDKGLLRSSMSAPTASRGGRRKRLYEVTAEGEYALRQARELRLNLWQQYPGFATDS